MLDRILRREPKVEPAKHKATWTHSGPVMIASLPNGLVVGECIKYAHGVYSGIAQSTWMTKEQAMRSYEEALPQYEWIGGPKPVESAT
jgi:hypothetical protein